MNLLNFQKFQYLDWDVSQYAYYIKEYNIDKNACYRGERKKGGVMRKERGKLNKLFILSRR